MIVRTPRDLRAAFKLLAREGTADGEMERPFRRVSCDEGDLNSGREGTDRYWGQIGELGEPHGCEGVVHLLIGLLLNKETY